MHVSGDRQFVTLAGNRRLQDQPADVEPADVEQDVGNERSVGIHRAQRRQAGKRRLRYPQRVDVDVAAAHVGHEVVVDLRLRHGEECALRVGEGQAAEGDVAPDIAVDPLDVDLEAGRELKIVDPLDDEAPAGIAVQPDQEAGHRDDDEAQDDREPLGDPHRRIAAPDDHHLIGGRGGGHLTASVRDARHLESLPD